MYQDDNLNLENTYNVWYSKKGSWAILLAVWCMLKCIIMWHFVIVNFMRVYIYSCLILSSLPPSLPRPHLLVGRAA